MIKGVFIKKLKKYTDDRGYLMEIFRRDENNFPPLMSYISSTNPNVVRGPHEHENQTDFFVFPGPGNFKLYLWDRRKDSETYKEYQEIEVGENNPCSVMVPPGVVHGYKCISEIPAWSINLPDQLYKGENKQAEIDEIRWEDKEDSPYKII
jgi:dTDP-4-dehydrorhamnose 3,5-epimerase